MKNNTSFTNDFDILECTLRDGSYAVNFRFTLKDTVVLAKLLSEAGFKFIEIGHGLGINASRSGKGEMPASDEEILTKTRAAVKGSGIGMFCIPGIADLNDLEKMSRSGLDFVRIGSNADEAKKTYPYIELARKYGVFTFVNMMKTYTIEPESFGRAAKKMKELGADCVYIVDSAGCMYPETIKEYISELRLATDIKFGFHGHDNLNFAVANSIEALKNGGNFIDTTMYGIGRDAGNAPTEVILAILESIGIDAGIDVFKVMDIAEKYLGPLKNKLLPRDMLSVAMGLGKFHSSFLPGARKIAEKYNVDLKKLVAKAGSSFSPGQHDAGLEETAKKIGPDTVTGENKLHDIVSFSASKIGRDYISNTINSVEGLLEGLRTISAKTQSKIALEIVPSKEHDDDLVMAEYLMADDDVVMGKICFGGLPILKRILDTVKDNVSFIVIDGDGADGWISPGEIYSESRGYFDENRIIVYSPRELINYYLLENILADRYRRDPKNILLCGERTEFRGLLSKISDWFDNIFIYETKPSGDEGVDYPEKCTVLKIPVDWKNLNINVDLIVCLSFLHKKELENILPGIKEGSCFIFTNQAMEKQVKDVLELKRFAPVYIDPTLVCYGQFRRWMRNGTAG